MISRYILKPGMALRIDGSALDTLSGYRQAYGANEVGGILLGREYLGREVVIEEPPPPT